MHRQFFQWHERSPRLVEGFGRKSLWIPNLVPSAIQRWRVPVPEPRFMVLISSIVWNQYRDSLLRNFLEERFVLWKGLCGDTVVLKC